MPRTKCTFTTVGATTLTAAVVIAGLGFGPGAAVAAPSEEAQSSASSASEVPTTDATTIPGSAGAEVVTSELPAPVVTNPLRHAANAVGGGVRFQYTVAGTLGAEVWIEDRTPGFAKVGTIGASGTVVIDTQRGHGGATLQLRDGSQVSGNTRVETADIPATLPAPEVSSAYRYTDAFRDTKFEYTISGTAGAEVWLNDRDPDDAHVGTIGEDGTAVITTDRGHGGATVLLRLAAQQSERVSIAVEDIKNQLPAPTVTGATRYIDSNGDTKYTYTITGITGATAQYRTQVGDFTRLGTIVANGATTFTGADGKNDGEIEFRQQLSSNGDSPIVAFRASDIVGTLAPVTVTTKTYNAGTTNRFEGTAHPGAQLQIVNNSGTVLVDGISVGADRKWSFSRAMSASATGFEFKVVQAMDGKTATSELFRVEAVKDWKPGAVDNQYVSSGVVNTFTGTATPGATIRVLNVSNTQIVNNTIRADQNGRWAFTRGISNDATNFRMKIEQRLGDDVRTSAVFTIDAAPITQARITGPSRLVPGVANTFTGTVDPDATIRILNGSGTRIVAPDDITVDANGTMAFDRVVSRTATEFRFKVEQTKDGYIRTSNVFTVRP
ncbi:hypothetical protein [Curtobacterium sp. PhB78]|uniref:hypothetical protein n=1 Tax=Curtobacterium sp. PhB78 TaxID=2485102 RepID=UPI000FA8DA82|nr:hypothetical protein [Curtobacterium sp. PhB78]ROS36169.1 hypothetical protein EDF53_2136 [Curtobacterium sp. PhB78]